MGGTKIFVVQVQQITKAIIFTVIGLILIGILVKIVLPKKPAENVYEESVNESSSALYYPGLYTSEIVLHNSPVQVEVIVTENEIVSVAMQPLDEVQATFYPLFEPTMKNLSKEIVKTQTVKEAESVDNSYTEEILIKAVKNALDKAEEEAYIKEVFKTQ